eukprot:scaffold1591_cov124-Pinguiococcus_pyrenoidosus.AAC.1
MQRVAESPALAGSLGASWCLPRAAGRRTRPAATGILAALGHAAFSWGFSGPRVAAGTCSWRHGGARGGSCSRRCSNAHL